MCLMLVRRQVQLICLPLNTNCSTGERADVPQSGAGHNMFSDSMENIVSARVLKV